ARKQRFRCLSALGVIAILAGAFAAYFVPINWRARTGNLVELHLLYLALAIVAPLFALGKWFLSRAVRVGSPSDLGEPSEEFEQHVEKVEKAIADLEDRIKQIERKNRPKETSKEGAAAVT